MIVLWFFENRAPELPKIVRPVASVHFFGGSFKKYSPFGDISRNSATPVPMHQVQADTSRQVPREPWVHYAPPAHCAPLRTAPLLSVESWLHSQLLQYMYTVTTVCAVQLFECFCCDVVTIWPAQFVRCFFVVCSFDAWSVCFWL